MTASPAAACYGWRMSGSRRAAFLLSLLARQYLLLKEDGFTKRYAHPWLVWEPGAWNAPSPGENPSIASTRTPPMGTALTPKVGDALCFSLEATKATLLVGRSSDSDIVINDMTVSREHLVLSHDGAAWAVEAKHGTTTSGSGAVVLPGVRVPLEQGATLKVGGSVLTFWSAPAFLGRVKAAAQRTAKEA